MIAFPERDRRPQRPNPITNLTLRRATRPLKGVGLHGGRQAEVTVEPTLRARGVRFVRADRASCPEIPADLTAARPSPRCTELWAGGVAVRTVEHLLAALAGLGVEHARVVVHGDEIPALDGSARPWVNALIEAGVCPMVDAPARSWRLTRPLAGALGDQRCLLAPAPRLEIRCAVDFANPRVGRQQLQLVGPTPNPGQGETGGWLDRATFINRLAPARTLGFLHEVTALRRAGLARGAHLGNALVFDHERVINAGGTRFLDEPVRHKLLDALGDLSLVGGTPRVAARLIRCSHRLLVATLRLAEASGVLVHEVGGTEVAGAGR